MDRARSSLTMYKASKASHQCRLLAHAGTPSRAISVRAPGNSPSPLTNAEYHDPASVRGSKPAPRTFPSNVASSEPESLAEEEDAQTLQGLTTRGTAQDRRQALNRIRQSPSYRARYRLLDTDNPTSHPANASSSGSSATPLRPPTSGISTITSRYSTTAGSGPSRPPTSQPVAASAEHSKSSSDAQSSPVPTTAEEGDVWAFGGGERSRGGPVGGPEAPARPGKTSPLIVSGDGGKGAVLGYGRRRRPAPSDTKMLGGAAPAGSEAEQATRYTHEYAPSTRSPHPLPQHTYFSSPSSSFNTASFAAPSTIPLNPALAAGAGGSSSASAAAAARRKKTALIMPGQGSQYVAMSRDIYKAFRSARSVWHRAEEALTYTSNSYVHHPQSNDRAMTLDQRRLFEAELAKTAGMDRKKGFAASGTAVARGRRGWLRDLVFSGDQLDLTRAENAQPAILTATLSFLAVLRKEFDVDLVSEHATWAAGHGSGTYAALVASGALDLSDAVRLLRHRGLIASKHLSEHPVLFPPGSTPPASVYETWAFANAGSALAGMSTEADAAAAVAADTARAAPRTDGDVARTESSAQDLGRPQPTSVAEGYAAPRRGWKRTQMSGVVVRHGKMDALAQEVERVSKEIREGRVPGVARDEVVEIANFNSSLQVVLSGTRVGVSYACDLLRAKGIGARAVNLPVSGPYHTSLMIEAADFLRPSIEHLPLCAPSHDLSLVSSVDGSVLRDVPSIRSDLAGAFAKPVRWLSSIDALLDQGVQRFVCLGPGRACAHLLSKELAHRDRVAGQQTEGASEGANAQSRDLEVWSIATIEDLEHLGKALNGLSVAEGAKRPVDARVEQLVAI